MLGHTLSFLICLMVGHRRDLLWHVGPRGLGWKCPRCLRVKDSEAVRKVAA